MSMPHVCVCRICGQTMQTPLAEGIERLEGELRKAPGNLKSYDELLLESERLSTKESGSE